MRILLCFAVTVFAAPAFAQAKPLEQVYACAGLTDGAARLACFDAAVSGLKRADDTGSVSVVSREQIEKAEKEAFGLAPPSLSTLVETQADAPSSSSGASAKTAEAKLQPLDKVTLAIKEISTAADGRYRVAMENGQVWRQTDDIKLGGLSQKNLTAEIRKGALGTFVMKIGNRSAIRVKRVD
jgi:hypothetical protein